ncbi:hypothetical protein C8A00DRAFT_34520 [Chaetomidium leptoderma]|uniref:Uncharacterized protein n=1 Tax=Chaetomidium leptoderma TaxID=669021 RepID=A0AAN6ZVS6_9PEZI|nr:hypothetical protein C8A00DRAFT_34520 [Chaetomidium leptoderma]
MHHIAILVAAVLFNNQVSVAVPLASNSDEPSEVGQPCGKTLGDCAGILTCTPLSTNCTEWVTNWPEGCPGTCQEIDVSQQQIYTLCGGWQLMDDCDERRERCVADPRHADPCGPSCDGAGICWPFDDVCGGDTGRVCPEGKACFMRSNFAGVLQGKCFPLRFGSDAYEKTGLEEMYRTDQDGYQEDEP